MRKINNVAYTEKGVLKNAVRTAILGELPTEALEKLGFEHIESKHAFVMGFEDINGDSTYLTLTVSVGKDPRTKASRTRKPSSAEVIEIE